MIRLCSLSDLNKYQKAGDLNFMIVRNMKEPIAGVQQFERLAPSSELYSLAMLNRDNPDFFETYKAAFNEELCSYEKQVGLSLIEELAKSFDINLICYCKDYSTCHRSLVYEALLARGIECELY